MELFLIVILTKYSLIGIYFSKVQNNCNLYKWRVYSTSSHRKSFHSRASESEAGGNDCSGLTKQKVIIFRLETLQQKFSKFSCKIYKSNIDQKAKLQLYKIIFLCFLICRGLIASQLFFSRGSTKFYN